MSFLKNNIAIALLLSTALLFSAEASSPDPASPSNNRGIFQLMYGPSDLPFSESQMGDRNDTFYQNCDIRINGVVVGKNTAAYTDANGNQTPATDNNGNPVPNGGHVTFIHDAGGRGMFTLTVQGGPGVPIVQPDIATADAVNAFPELITLSEEDGIDYLAAGYKVRIVNTDLELGVSGNVTQWEGRGIYKNVTKLTVRCAFLIAPNGDLIKCLNCLFYFEKGLVEEVDED